MKKFKHSLSAIIVGSILCLTFTGCSDNNSRAPYSLELDAEVKPVEIIRLDSIIEVFASADSLTRYKLIDNNSDMLLGLAQFAAGIDTINESEMVVLSTSPATTMFMPPVNAIYHDMNRESKSIWRILATAKQNELPIRIDRFATATWGDQRPIMVIDSLRTLFIALNHYLGAENPAYDGWPNYRKALKTRDMIPVDVADVLLRHTFPKQTAAENTVLSNLLYEGALAVGRQAMVPEAPLHYILGYSDEDFKQILEHESFIWKHLTADNMLYSTDGTVISSLFDRRPASTLISPDAPGRAAVYIGYRIVSEYIKSHPQTTLRHLLSPEFYNNGLEVLRDSNFEVKKAE